MIRFRVWAQTHHNSRFNDRNSYSFERKQLNRTKNPKILNFWWRTSRKRKRERDKKRREERTIHSFSEHAVRVATFVYLSVDFPLSTNKAGFFSFFSNNNQHQHVPSATLAYTYSLHAQRKTDIQNVQLQRTNAIDRTHSHTHTFTHIANGQSSNECVCVCVTLCRSLCRERNKIQVENEATERMTASAKYNVFSSSRIKIFIGFETNEICSVFHSKWIRWGVYSAQPHSRRQWHCRHMPSTLIRPDSIRALGAVISSKMKRRSRYMPRHAPNWRIAR